jgi:hypothetical protein
MWRLMILSLVMEKTDGSLSGLKYEQAKTRLRAGYFKTQVLSDLMFRSARSEASHFEPVSIQRLIRQFPSTA